jgi:hypothetical protein
MLINILVKKKDILSVIVLLTTCQLHAQNTYPKNEVSLSWPFIWNHSEATYYQLGSPKTPDGKAISYGVDFSYGRIIERHWMIKLGAGYFKQRFNIERPFDFDNPTNLAYHTQSYQYDNLDLSGGIYYKRKINTKSALVGGIRYSFLYSFRQKYIVDKELKTWQVNHQSFSLSDQCSLSIGYEKMLSQCISVRVDLVAPIYTRWHKDSIFPNSYYSDKELQVAQNIFSIGASVSFNYSF